MHRLKIVAILFIINCSGGVSNAAKCEDLIDEMCLRFTGCIIDVKYTQCESEVRTVLVCSDVKSVTSDYDICMSGLASYTCADLCPSGVSSSCVPPASCDGVLDTR